MVITHKDTHVFPHNWALTVEGAFGKYPNDFQPNIQSLDILSREINQNGELVTEKLLRSRFIPNFLMRKSMAALGMPVLTSQMNLEQSRLDLEKNTYTMETCNETYLTWMKIRETLIYSEVNTSDTCKSDTTPSRTLLSQSTSCDMYSSLYHPLLQWAVSLGEKAIINEVKSNIPKGRNAMADVISKLIIEFENFGQLTEAKLRENSELAHLLIKKFGSEAVEGLQQIQTDLNDIQLKADELTDELTRQIKSKVSKLDQSCEDLKMTIKNQSITDDIEKLIKEIITRAEKEIIALLAALKEKMEVTYQESLNFRLETETKIEEIFKQALTDMEEIRVEGVNQFKTLQNSSKTKSSSSTAYQSVFGQNDILAAKLSKEFFERTYLECKNTGAEYVGHNCGVGK